MKILLLLCAVQSLVWAADNDTIPLKRKGPAVKSNTQVTEIAPKPTEKEKLKAAEEAMPKPYVAGIDTFGSTKINETILKQTLGNDLTVWINKGLSGDPTSPKMEAKLAKTIQDKFGFALTEWSILQYYEPGDLAVYLTLDVVEKGDVATRMPFFPEPTAEVPDPDGLIKNWLDYEDAALELVETGSLDPDSSDCPALHCPFGHKHLKLKKYEKIFVEGVPKNEKGLTEVLSKDKRIEHRAAAAFLLAYLKDGKKVVSLMIDRIKDPEPHVRNNVLRVLGDIAEFHPEFPIPSTQVVEALGFARASDRSKALYVLHRLTLNSQAARDTVMKIGVPSLIALLSGKPAEGRELAQGILRKVSGKDYAASDVPAWTAWYKKLPKDRGVTAQ